MLCLNLSLNNRGLILVKYLSTLDPSVRIIRSQSDHWWKVFYCCFSIFFELQWNNNNYSGNNDDDDKCDKLKKILQLIELSEFQLQNLFSKQLNKTIAVEKLKTKLPNNKKFTATHTYKQQINSQRGFPGSKETSRQVCLGKGYKMKDVLPQNLFSRIHSLSNQIQVYSMSVCAVRIS